MVKAKAIQILWDAGHLEAAAQLDGWRNIHGTNSGWDGWLRGHFPHVVEIVWPTHLQGQGLGVG